MRRWPAQAGSELLRSRAFRRTALVLLGVLVLVAGAAVIELMRATSELRSVESALDRVDDLVDDGDLGGAAAALDAAFVEADRANGRLYGNPALDLVGTLPIGRQQLDSLRSSVGTGLTLIDGGRRILAAGAPLTDASGQLEVPLRDGAIPVAAVGEVRRALADTSAALPRLRDRPADRWLFGPVEDLQQQVAEQAEARARQFKDVADALRVVEELAGGNGDRRFLIAVANSAEMRGTGGMILSYGILESSDGDFELGAFGRIDELRLSDPLDAEAVDLPEDYLRRWSGFDVTELWRNATMSADLPLVAPTMLQMFEQATGLTADGVIQIDPSGLAAILEGTGPVDVAGLGMVTAVNVVDLTLNEAYFRFSDIESRSDVLSDVAEAAFDRLVNGDYPSLRPLAEELLRVSHERHLSMYSTDAEVQAVLDRFGASNHLPPTWSEYVHLAVQNVSGNKLDYYVDVGLELAGSRPAGEQGEVTARIDVANSAPASTSEPRYIFGPFNDEQRAGDYRGIVTLYVPRGTSLISADGGDIAAAPSVQTEDDRTVISYTVAVGPQSTSSVDLELRLPPRPPGPYTLLAIPSPRVRPIGLDVTIAVDGDQLSTSFPIEVPMLLAPSSPPRPQFDG